MVETAARRYPEKVIVQGDGAELELRYSFTKEELGALGLFIENCDALHRCTWFREGKGLFGILGGSR